MIINFKNKNEDTFAINAKANFDINGLLQVSRESSKKFIITKEYYESFLYDYSHQEFIDALKEAENILMHKDGGFLYTEIYLMLDKEFIDRNHEDFETLKTAGIGLKRQSSYGLTLKINTEFFMCFCSNAEQRAALLEHELLHVILGHMYEYYSLASNGNLNNGMASFLNVCMDLEINSLVSNYRENYNGKYSVNTDFIFAFPTKFKDKDDEETFILTSTINPLFSHYEDIHPNLSWKEYEELLLRDKERYKKHDGPENHKYWIIGDEDFDSIFKSLSELKDRVRIKTFDAIANGMLNTKGGAGTHKGERLLQALVKKYLPQPDYLSILENFVSSNLRDKEIDFTKESRRGLSGYYGHRYEYEHNVAVFIDQSGSMLDEDISKCLGRLGGLLNSASIKIFPFESDINFEDAYEVNDISEIKYERHSNGGTMFGPIMEFMKNNTEWDMAFVFSDMGCADTIDKVVDNVAFICDKGHTYTCTHTISQMRNKGFLIVEI